MTDRTSVELDALGRVIKVLDAQKLSDLANEAGCLSRIPGAVTLTPEASRLDLIAWCVWCDSNGSYRDEDQEDDWGPLTTAELWDCVDALVEGS